MGTQAGVPGVGSVTILYHRSYHRPYGVFLTINNDDVLMGLNYFSVKALHVMG